MLNKKKLCSIALVSIALIFMLVYIAGAAPFAFITNSGSNNVSVIDIATNDVTATVIGLNNPFGVAVTPDGTKAYMVNSGNGTVSVINTTNNTAYCSVNVGSLPYGVAVTPDRSTVYVTNHSSYYFPGNTVSVINTSTNSIIAMVPVGNSPIGVVVTSDLLSPASHLQMALLLMVPL